MSDDIDGSDAVSASGEPHDEAPRATDERLLLTVGFVALVTTALTVTSSRLLRRLDEPLDAVIASIATALAMVSVVLLFTAMGAFVLWIIVRFVDRE